jgi:hypothetical protein
MPCSGMIDHGSLSDRQDNSLLVVLLRSRFPFSVRTILIGAAHVISEDLHHFVNESVEVRVEWCSPALVLQRLAGP